MTAVHTWRKSSRSENDGTCVELRNTLDAIRDSKNTTGPTLRGDVRELNRAVRDGRFDR